MRTRQILGTGCPKCKKPAGPALFLLSTIVLQRIMGTKKAVVFISLVIIMATITGMFFGAIWG